MYVCTYGYINPNLYAHQKQASQRRHIAYLLKQSQIAQLCIMQFAQKLDKHIHTYRCVYSVDFHLSVLSYPKAFPPTFQPSTPPHPLQFSRSVLAFQSFPSHCMSFA